MDETQNTRAVGGWGVPPLGGQLDHEQITAYPGKYLPHWRRPGGTYFVTFRLADALPQSKVREWQAERDDIIATALQMKRSLSENEQERLEELSWKRIDEHLRRGYGSCWMKTPAIANLVASSLMHFDAQRYELFAWSVLPNHVHVVVCPYEAYPLEKILHSWKSYSAHQANKILGRSGAFWQPEYYDHLVRSDDDLRRCIEYTWENPEKAGLHEWRWRWKSGKDSLQQD